MIPLFIEIIIVVKWTQSRFHTHAKIIILLLLGISFLFFSFYLALLTHLAKGYPTQSSPIFTYSMDIDGFSLVSDNLFYRNVSSSAVCRIDHMPPGWHMLDIIILSHSYLSLIDYANKVNIYSVKNNSTCPLSLKVRCGLTMTT